eukprot:XP_011683709.1 PREDICTED: girdin-like [Strongylocentrotus purpuratus]
MKVELERREQSERAMTEIEKRTKQVLETNKQREIELEEKLKSNDLRIETMVAENLQRTEEAANREVKRLETENKELTKTLESKQQRVDTMTEIVRENEQEKTNLKQQVEDLTNEREEDRARFDEERRLMKKGKEAGKSHEDEIREHAEENKLLQRRVTDLEQELNESHASRKSIISETASLKDTKKVEQERREQSKIAITYNEKRGKQAMETDMQREIELGEKLKPMDSLIETLAENLQRTEKTVKREVERLETENEEMMKKLESGEQRENTLTKIVLEKERNETTLRQQVEELKKGREGDRARFEKDKRSVELSLEKKHDYKERRVEQLERETWKLRTKIQLESEMRSAELKKEADTHQSNFIPWMTSRKKAEGDDEFAGILQQIADDLYDEAKIDSLGGQLGILHGDIQRALKTNMKSDRLTSHGTRRMLKQWRTGVSREDERMELTRALQAAKLVHLADLCLSENCKKVHWDFLTDSPKELTLLANEVLISCGIRFSPSGAKFSEPIKVTLDHNAHFTNPRHAEIIFYTRNKGDSNATANPLISDQGSHQAAFAQIAGLSKALKDRKLLSGSFDLQGPSVDLEHQMMGLGKALKDQKLPPGSFDLIGPSVDLEHQMAGLGKALKDRKLPPGSFDLAGPSVDVKLTHGDESCMSASVELGEVSKDFCGGFTTLILAGPAAAWL